MSEAAERDYDVIVVGVGPGGFATALGAARAGLRVLVLDRKRFPRDKVCGDAITPLGASMLASIGALDAIRRVADEELPSIRIGSSAGSEIDVPTPIVVVRRRVLDAALLELLRPHVELREGHAVDRLMWRNGAVCGAAGRTEHGTRFEATAHAVVGADGASSIVARLTGCRDGVADRLLLATRAYYRGIAMSTRAPEFHFVPGLSGGYLWIFPAGGDRYNAGIGAEAEALKRSGLSLRQWWRAAVASAELAPRFASATQLTEHEGGQIPFSGTTQRLCGAGFVLVGDAAGVADAFWGDGIDTALASGTIAAAHLAAAARARDFGASQLAGYARGVARVLGPKLARGIERQRAAGLEQATRLGDSPSFPDVRD